MPRAVDRISFTRDEETMICRSEGELRLVSTGEGHAVRSLSVGQGQIAAIHPEGRWLLAHVREGHSNGLAIVDLPEGRVVRTLGTGLARRRARLTGNDRAEEASPRATTRRSGASRR